MLPREPQVVVALQMIGFLLISPWYCDTLQYMKIDYRAIQARMDARKNIADAFSGELHPWEAGFDLGTYLRTRTRIRYTKWSRGKEVSWNETHDYPYAWQLYSPMMLFIKLTRHEIDVPYKALHGRACAKCNALRALRQKTRYVRKAIDRALLEDEDEYSNEVYPD
jgi:hypothetical protein